MDRGPRIRQTERQADRQEGWVVGNGFINTPFTTIISLEIWRSPGELLKGARWPDECPGGNVCVCVCKADIWEYREG